MPGRPCPKIHLPKGWQSHVKSAVLHAISLAHYAIVYARGWAVNSPIKCVRLKADNERLIAEWAMLAEQNRIKDVRMARIDPHRRPHYPPSERLALLELKAARGWSLEQTARAFLVTAATIASWIARVDEDGPDALVQLRTPVNRFPDFVRYIVQRLKVLCPSMGKLKIAETLARAGLHLGATTVGRMLQKKPRFGAVGEYGSIAVIERLISTTKRLLRLLPHIPLRRDAFRREVACVTEWYNQHRPHASLGGGTPNERYFGRFPAKGKPRFEPRDRWPRGSPCARPWALVRSKPGARLQVDVEFPAGRRHLAVVGIRRAA